MAPTYPCQRSIIVQESETAYLTTVDAVHRLAHSEPSASISRPSGSTSLSSKVRLLRNHSGAPHHHTPPSTPAGRVACPLGVVTALRYIYAIRAYDILPVRCTHASCGLMRYTPAVPIPCTGDTPCSLSGIFNLGGRWTGRHLIQTGMHIGCGSTAYSIGTVYGGKGHLSPPRPRRLNLVLALGFLIEE